MSASLTQTAADPPQPTSPRKRTPAERQRRDNYTRHVRWAGVTATSEEGKLLRAVRADLTAHVGGKPSTTERLMIEQVAMLSLHLARLDASALRGTEMSEHAAKQYLGFSNSKSRLLRHLGIKAAPRPGMNPFELRLDDPEDSAS